MEGIYKDIYEVESIITKYIAQGIKQAKNTYWGNLLVDFDPVKKVIDVYFKFYEEVFDNTYMDEVEFRVTDRTKITEDNEKGLEERLKIDLKYIRSLSNILKNI